MPHQLIEYIGSDEIQPFFYHQKKKDEVQLLVSQYILVLIFFFQFSLYYNLFNLLLFIFYIVLELRIVTESNL